MTCFQCDANSHSDHSFHSFLAPKPSPSCFLSCRSHTISLTDDMPDLSNSIYTNSTFSKASSFSSIFTRRRSDLISRDLMKFDDDNKKDQEVSCCDYCENLKDENLPLLSSYINKDKPVNRSSIILAVK